MLQKSNVTKFLMKFQREISLKIKNNNNIEETN